MASGSGSAGQTYSNASKPMGRLRGSAVERLPDPQIYRKHKKSLRERLRDWLNDSGEEATLYGPETKAVNDEPNFSSDKIIRFAIYPARGGCVVEATNIDAQRGDRSTTIHVIPEDKDISEEIGKIVSIEYLKS